MNNVNNQVKIVSIWGYCPEYDTRYCNNGGSYYQPKGGVLFDIHGQPVYVEIDDQSCGDFGSRIFVTIESDSHEWHINFGTMDDASIMSDAETEETLASITGVLKINDPWSLITETYAAMEWAA